MKYIKLYENSINPIFIKFYDKLLKVFKDIDSDITLTLHRETDERFTLIQIKYKNEKQSDGKGRFADDIDPERIIALDKKKYIMLLDTFYIPIIDNLITYITDSLKLNIYNIKYSEIDTLIERLDDFELWLTAKKYNL